VTDLTTPGGLIATEYVRSKLPFVVRRQVRWSECDPAGVVFTGVFPNYVISAVQLLRDYLFGSWIEHLKVVGLAAPAKAISLEFHHMLAPNDRFDMTVLVSSVSAKTITYEVDGRCDNGDRAFVGRLTSIFVATGEGRGAQPVPAGIREVIETYQHQSRVI
jgi:4-hydroxybenzoyl-CoA thioesterase